MTCEIQYTCNADYSWIYNNIRKTNYARKIDNTFKTYFINKINYTRNYRSKITSIESAGRVVAADKAPLTPSSPKTTQNRFIKFLQFPIFYNPQPMFSKFIQWKQLNCDLCVFSMWYGMWSLCYFIRTEWPCNFSKCSICSICPFF